MTIPIVYTMDLGGVECQTTVGLRELVTDTADAALPLTIFWAQGLMIRLSNQVNLTSIKVGPDLFAASATGGIAQHPANASVGVMMLKNNSGRVGRFFLPGPLETDVAANGQLLSTLKTAMTTAANDELAILNGLGYDLVVDDSLGVMRSITSLSVADVVGLQGRRRFGH